MKIKNKNLAIFLQVLAILVFGIVLLILVFGFCALVYTTCDRILGTGHELEPRLNWQYHVLRVSIFIGLIAVTTYYVYKSKLIAIYKATWTMVPTAIALVSIGILTYQRPYLSYTLGSVVILGILAYLYNARKSWMYYLSILFVAIALLIMGITGTDI
ncbi:MAG: hypothetical protein ACD_58C00167G0015 [uncultured bacterium]|nr:MAG: hypothetical protein ACD_58C00167G0015 [uncultured bacterium]